MSIWKKLTTEEIKERIFGALKNNIDYKTRVPLGIPGSHLDSNVFYTDPMVLKDAPFLSSLVQNPNHIGCHTIGESESFFEGTHAIENEVIRICAEDILGGPANEQDGYIAAGGTEANIQAIWVYRNYYKNQKGVEAHQIGLICSEDSHYSMNKAANLLGVALSQVKVNHETRQIDPADLDQKVKSFADRGITHVIAVANMMTTMFGSVDSVKLFVETFKKNDIDFKIHIDGAYGGFVFPFISEDKSLTFANPHVSSVTLDAHKMVQAPYGTGIFLVKKGLIHNVYTNEAKYVQGLDVTLSGSRSGANAISVWMILQTYGPNGWHEKIHLLGYRGDWLQRQLNRLGIEYYRTEGSNILTMKSDKIPFELVKKFGLVPDSHGENPNWYKIIIMDHVTVDALKPFIEDLETSINMK